MQSLDDVPFEDWAFDWDEAKRRSNLEKHGIDFLRAVVALGGSRLELKSDRNGEARTLAICPDTSKLIAVVYTMRGTRCRIISARAARDNEQRAYRQLYL
ncbi:BrnT family toxin [Rhizobium sp. 18065]|uniref:BrnT family toxin n=1 Tax=Rhizobium sp. 18065 TaxID=2681411 RepID=UPI00135BF410|nr:BrnT family toxin [Rhizobium sp. 18065]